MRFERMLEAIPGSSSVRSLKRRGPSSSASTISNVQRSPTRATASCNGEPGGPSCTLFWRGSGMASSYADGTPAMCRCRARITRAVVGIGRGWGRGSGVVVADGSVVTNAHNLRGDQVTVVFADGRSVTGQVSGVDVDGDLAVVAVDTGGATPVGWADEASSVGVGSVVFALANPGGRARVTT